MISIVTKKIQLVINVNYSCLYVITNICMACDSNIGIFNIILQVFCDLIVFIRIKVHEGTKYCLDHMISDGKET